MAILVSEPESASNALERLQHPSWFLPILAASPNEDIAFYSMDCEGKFVYLSPSAKEVLNQDPKAWLGRSFREALTESSCNAHFRNSRPIDFIESSCILEILDGLGNRLSLKFWTTTLMHDDRPVGKAGMIQRLTGFEADLQGQCIPIADLRAKANLLSEPERQVIDMVFDGKLNKTIARDLAVSMRTVEGRRSKSMKKLGVTTFAELIQVWGRIKEL